MRLVFIAVLLSVAGLAQDHQPATSIGRPRTEAEERVTTSPGTDCPANYDNPVWCADLGVNCRADYHDRSGYSSALMRLTQTCPYQFLPDELAAHIVRCFRARSANDAAGIDRCRRERPLLHSLDYLIAIPPAYQRAAALSTSRSRFIIDCAGRYLQIILSSSNQMAENLPRLKNAFENLLALLHLESRGRNLPSPLLPLRMQQDEALHCSLGDPLPGRLPSIRRSTWIGANSSVELIFPGMTTEYVTQACLTGRASRRPPSAFTPEQLVAYRDLSSEYDEARRIVDRCTRRVTGGRDYFSTQEQLHQCANENAYCSILGEQISEAYSNSTRAAMEAALESESTGASDRLIHRSRRIEQELFSDAAHSHTHMVELDSVRADEIINIFNSYERATPQDRCAFMKSGFSMPYQLISNTSYGDAISSAYGGYMLAMGNAEWNDCMRQP